MKVNFLNRILLTMNHAIRLFLITCSSVPATTPPVLSPITAGITPAVETTPPIDFTGIKATRPWRIAFIPKFKLLGETGKLSSYWQPAWEGATFYFTLGGVS
ncbi:MAG: hypothetical protein MUO77_01610 [Anaerolineales bacterium]|nr:hypothetical protein [Anaerolineales bacterium]